MPFYICNNEELDCGLGWEIFTVISAKYVQFYKHGVNTKLVLKSLLLG